MENMHFKLRLYVVINNYKQRKCRDVVFRKWRKCFRWILTRKQTSSYENIILFNVLSFDKLPLYWSRRATHKLVHEFDKNLLFFPDLRNGRKKENELTISTWDFEESVIFIFELHMHCDVNL